MGMEYYKTCPFSSYLILKVGQFGNLLIDVTLIDILYSVEFPSVLK